MKYQDTKHGRLFEEQGFVIFGQLVHESLLNQIRDQADEAVKSKAPPIVFDEESQQVYDAVPEAYRDASGRVFRRLNRVIDRGGAFERVALGPVADAVATVLPTPIYVCLNRHNMMMLKAPYNPTPVYWHQDAAVWNDGTFAHCSAIVAIDEFHEHNGCLHVVPKSHRLGPIALGWADNTTIIESRYADLVRNRAIPVLLKPGDVLLFHGLLLHGSPGNNSGSSRRSLTLCYCHGDLSMESTRQTLGETARDRPITRLAMADALSTVPS